MIISYILTWCLHHLTCNNTGVMLRALQKSYSQNPTPFLQYTQTNTQITLNCYRDIVASFWRHLTSLVPKCKTHEKTNEKHPCERQNIKDRSRKHFTPQVRDGAGSLVPRPLLPLNWAQKKLFWKPGTIF